MACQNSSEEVCHFDDMHHRIWKMDIALMDKIKQDLTFFKVKLDSEVDRERLVRIELKQYENMDRAERQLINTNCIDTL